jgi:hypothetical protein
MLAGGANALLGGEFHAASGWTTSAITDATNDGPAVTLTSATTGIGLIRSTANSGELRSLTWSPGAWSTTAALGAGITTRATPSLAASAGLVSAAFQGDNFKHYYAAYLASWNPTAEAVGGSASQSFGPSQPTIAALGMSAVVAFAGNDGDLYDQTRSSGAWSAADGHGVGGTVSLTPTIVAMTAGPDLMIVYIRKTDSRVLYTTRTNGVWSLPPAVTDMNALSGDPVSVAALPGGAAVMAYRGLDGNVYWSRYTMGAATPWSPPAALATPNFATPSSPAVTAGLGGMDAEMVFVDGATGGVKHARLMGTSWSAPAVVGGNGLTHVGASSVGD